MLNTLIKPLYFAASVGLVLTGAALSCHAQELPQGSYTRSCTGCDIEGNSLVCLTCESSRGRLLESRIELNREDKRDIRPPAKV